MQATHSKVCYIQSAKAARAAVKALIAAGYASYTDRSGYVYSVASRETAQPIVDAAIKGIR